MNAYGRKLALSLEIWKGSEMPVWVKLTHCQRVNRWSECYSAADSGLHGEHAPPRYPAALIRPQAIVMPYGSRQRAPSRSMKSSATAGPQVPAA